MMTKGKMICSTLLATFMVFSFSGIALADDLNNADMTGDPTVYEEPAQIDRTAMIEELVVQWTSDNTAAYELRVTLEHANDSKLLAAWQADSIDEIRTILKGGSDLDGPSALGDPDEDYTFTPITPCRIVDTRNAGGMLTAGGTRSFVVHGNVSSQGGNATGCASPVGEPRAVMINLTASSSATGNLRAYPAGETTPNASMVNYKPGVNIANTGAVKTAYLFGDDLEIYSSASSHVIIDVVGYYSMPELTRPDQFITSSGTVSIDVGTESVYAPECPSGYRVSGGGGGVNSWTAPVELTSIRPVMGTSPVSVSGANAADRFVCQFDNNDTVDREVFCNTVCIRIPGR